MNPIKKYGVVTTAILSISLVFGAIFLLLFISYFETTAHTGDFYVFHDAMRRLAEGDAAPSELYSPAESSLWVYPPHIIPFLLPFGYLDIGPAHLVWGLLTLGSAAISAWLLGARGLALGAVAINPLTVFVAGFGQMNALPLLGLCVGLSFLRTNHLAAGFFLALMTVKPQLALPGLLIIAVGGHIRVGLAYGASLFAMVLISALVFGFDAWSAFIERAVSFSAEARTGFEDVPYGLQLSVYGAMRNIGLQDAPALVLHFASIIIFIAVVLWKPSAPTITTAGLTLPLYNLSTGLMMLMVPVVMTLNQKPRSVVVWFGLALFAFVTVIQFFQRELAAISICGVGLWVYFALLMRDQSRSATTN